MRKSLIITLLVLLNVLAQGCQFTVEGPRVQASIYRKDEPVEARNTSPRWAGTSNGGNVVDRWLRANISEPVKKK